MVECVNCAKFKGCNFSNPYLHECVDYQETQTNEQWIKQCTTEQLADVFFDYRYANATPRQKLWMSASEECIKTDIVKWLKQPHTKE